MRVFTIGRDLTSHHKNLFCSSFSEISKGQKLHISIPIIATYLFVGGFVLFGVGIEIKNTIEKWSSQDSLIYKTFCVVKNIFITIIAFQLFFGLFLALVKEKKILTGCKFATGMTHYPLLLLGRLINNSPSIARSIQSSSWKKISLSTTLRMCKNIPLFVLNHLKYCNDQVG